MSELARGVVRRRTRNKEAAWLVDRVTRDSDGLLSMREILKRYEEEELLDSLVGKNRERVRKNFQRAFGLMGVKRKEGSDDYGASWLDRSPPKQAPRKGVPNEELRAFCREYVGRRRVRFMPGAILEAFVAEHGPIAWPESDRAKEVFRDELITALE